MFDFRRVLIAGNRTEAITGDPQIDMRRLNLYDLGKSAGRPVRFYAANDERLSLNRFRLLMLDGCRVAIAQLGQRELALRGIDLF